MPFVSPILRAVAELLLLLIVALIIAAYFGLCAVTMLPGWLLYSRLEDRPSTTAKIARGLGVVWMGLAWIAVTGFYAYMELPLPDFGPGQVSY